ncbi:MULTISPECIES: hypothetical protein [unclassified Methanosarcina]|uniref:hypothetical protein n=1 Tax=unclassified Methanosarcina TaxID=2644672 RepID=UPI0006160115|nr:MULTISPECIES: hypothetical protein [unclassified Methanosarcina]AKB18031.1 hypothetical protein MSWHS_1168 [Methanosarcina sp. WWM596]AKB21367.1 hypothetical protein MSWH1_1096 [Methanosarcina sp. WH1]
MKLFDLIKIFNPKNISIFSVLLIMFSIVPSCALAVEEITQPSFPEEDFDVMQSRMIESVDRMIEALENSTEDLDADTLELVEELISGLTSIKEEISNAETTSDLQMVREELDTLLEAVPEELKNISGFGMGPDSEQAQNGSNVPPRGAGNMSEGRSGMPERANVMSENASMDKQRMPDRASNEQEKAGMEEGNDNALSSESGFFEKLINSLKSLFS